MPPLSQPRERSVSDLIPELQLIIIDYLGLPDKASLIESGTLLPELVVRTEKLDEGDGYGSRLLHAAIEQGYERATEHLLLAGAPASPGRSTSETTPLLHASQQGNLAIVNILLDHGASVHEWEWSGIYPLHHAAEHGHTRVAQRLLDLGAKQENNFDIGAPLHLAATNGHDAVVRILTAHGEDASSTRWGVTALWLAVFGGQVDCVRALLEAGADVKGNTQQADFIIPPPLLLAAAGPHFRLASDIATEASIRDICQSPALAWLPGQKESYAEVVRLLVTSGVDISQELDLVTALHLAAIVGNCLAVEILISAGADIHRRTRNGWSALMFARVLNHEDTTKLLFKGQAGTVGRTETSYPAETERYIQRQAHQSHSLTKLL